MRKVDAEARRDFLAPMWRLIALGVVMMKKPPWRVMNEET
jgi:hypothetical protein